MRKLLVLFMAVLSLAGCSEKDASDIVLFVTPSSYSVSGGDRMYFDVTSMTIHDYVALFEVSSFDAENGRQDLDVIEPKTKRFSYRYEYVVPAMEVQGAVVEMMFCVTDNLGNRSETTVRLNVGKGTMLNEMSGITLWSPASGKDDAFSLSLLQTVNSASASEKDVDIFVMPEPDSENLGLSWGTRTGVKFVRANSFDYASATSSSLSSAYSASVTSDTVEDIRLNDVILVGRDSKAVGVFKVIQIFDEEGTLNDRYILNFKSSAVQSE